MEVQLHKGFFKSLRKLLRRNTWYNVALRAVFEGFPNFVKNVWRFRKELWEHRWYDWRYHIMMLRRSLQIMVDPLETHGLEVDESRLKKVKMMRRAIEILLNIENDNFISMAEAELGEIRIGDVDFKLLDNGNYEMITDEEDEVTEHNRKVFKRADEIEIAQWDELWSILKGPNLTDMQLMRANLNNVDVEKVFDGSGITSWWD